MAMNNMMAKCADIIYRITVFENNSGIPLFDFINESVNEIGYDEILYTGAMQGLNIIIQEAINCGCINEMVLDNAQLLISHDKSLNISYVIITEGITDTIRDLFQIFQAQFNQKYSEIIKLNKLNSNFDSATTLVEEIFTFIKN